MKVAILRSIASHIGGGGGGRPTIAQGGGSNPEGLGSAPWMKLGPVLGLSAGPMKHSAPQTIEL